MKLTGCERDLMRRLAEMPFLDRLEMVAVSGWSRGAVYEGVRRLEAGEFAASVPHAADLIPPTRRYHLTAAGLRRLAQAEGVSVDDLLRSRPVSAQWRRILLERLDAVAVIYRLASAISNAVHPIRLRLYRAKPMDAAILLPGGRTVAVVRQGLTSDRTGFSKRLWRLREGALTGAVLLLMPDETRLRYARRLLAGSPAPAFLALERDAASAGPADPVWRPPAVNATLDLRSALARIRPGGALPTEPQLSRATLPASDGAGLGIPDYMLPAPLKPAERRALDLLFDWPWISQKDLASLLAVSEPRASQFVTPLEGFGLATRLSAAGRRLALTDRGLAMLARRDRASVGVARRRWSVAPIDPEGPADWRNVSGARSRQLLRNIEHTEAVHSFIAALARQARSLSWEIVQLDPPRRASRYFRRGDRLRSIHPDAFGVLRRGPVTWPFFLEWERRAVRPHHDGGPPCALSSLLLITPAHRRPRSTARRPRRIRRRPGGDPLPARGAGGDGQDPGQGPPVGLPRGRPRRAGAAGTRLALARRLGTRPRPPRGAEYPVRTGVERRLPLRPERRFESYGFGSHRRIVRPPEASGTHRRPAQPRGALGAAQQLPGRSQNWLAGKAGISPGYLSMLVNEGRAPSGRIRRRMQQALGIEDFHQLFTLEDRNENP